MMIRISQLGIFICILVLHVDGFPKTKEMTRGFNIQSRETWIVASNGSGQFISIQEAIDQANNGDTISIKEGNYAEDVTVHSKERLKLIGEGMDKVFITGLNRVGTLHIGKWPYGAKKVEISGMTIKQHGGLGVGIFNGVDVTLKNIKVNGLVFVQQVKNVQIENCIIGRSETTGLAFANSQATLIGNLIHDNDHGVSVGGNSRVNLERNVIIGSLFEAVLVADQGRSTLARNTLVNNGGGVKFLDKSSGDLKGNIIVNAKVGVAFAAKDQLILSYNALHNNGTDYQSVGNSVGNLNIVDLGSTDVHVPPGFVAPHIGDFRLKSDSPLQQVGGFLFLGALGPILE